MENASKEEDDTRAWVEEHVSIPESWSITGKELNLDFGPGTPKCLIRAHHVKELAEEGQYPSSLLIKRVRDCGIIVGNYAEFLVDFTNWGTWPNDEPLVFKVGETTVRVGPLTEAYSLLLESTYRSKDHFQFDFQNHYSSLQLVGTSNAERDAKNALFYLNSDYLRPIRSSARIIHLIDPNGPDPYPELGDPAKISRKRIRCRDVIPDVEPMSLYNAASVEVEDARFLGFYRVLEFYFRRGSVLELGRLRRDPSVTDEALLKLAKIDNELLQLEATLRSTLTAPEVKSLASFVTFRKLANVETVEQLAKSIYGHRNTLVHAKESEVRRGGIPDPFRLDTKAYSWAWVVEQCASKAVRRFSSQKARKRAGKA